MYFDVRIDFRNHRGTHPTLGSVDNICFSPLGDESLTNISTIAREFSDQLSGYVGVPIYLYGYAHLSTKDGKPMKLRDIRQELGYFGNDCKSQQQVLIEPSFGSLQTTNSRSGVSCIGSMPFIENFNIRFAAGTPRSIVTRVTSAVREVDLV